MFDQNGLSLDQAPPIGVVFGLFFMGAIFGVLSGVSILYYGADILSPYTTGAVVFTHIMTLGVMLSFMLGALFQMLPVIAGVVISDPIRKARPIVGMVAGGVVSLLAGFICGAPWLFIIASVLLGGAIFHTTAMMIPRLYRLANHSASSIGMLISLIALLITGVFALLLTTSMGGLWDGVGMLYMDVKETHYSFGIFGWVATLIISISFQTVEMFYVTPPYPKFMSRYLPSFILLALVVGATFSMLHLTIAWVGIEILVAIMLILYSITTLHRIQKRKRPLTDATVLFWYLGMGSLLVSMILLLSNFWIHSESIAQIVMVLYGSFALSVLFAMFYKIVPFLTWFHLNSQGYFTAPMMHEVIHPKNAKKHLWIHISLLVSFIIGIFVHQVLILSGVLAIASFGTIAYHIYHAHTLYRDTQAHGEKFEFDMPTMS